MSIKADKTVLPKCKKDTSNKAIRGIIEKNNLQSQIKESISVLNSMSEIRPEKVVLGKARLQDPNYPGDEVLEKVADALLGEQEK